MSDQYLRDAIDYIISELNSLKDDGNAELIGKLEQLSSSLNDVKIRVDSVNSIITDKKKLKELLAPVLGVDYFTDKDIEHIVKLCTPKKGVHYFDGRQGDPGQQGKPGEKGDKPKHKWEGTKIYFENPDGSWDKGVDLQGKPGAPGRGGDGGRAIGTLIRVALDGTVFDHTLGQLNFSGLNVTYDSFGKFNVTNPYTYPALTGEANKVLAVKSDETGVEWKTDAVNDLTAYDLQNAFKVATASAYKEITYTDGAPTLIEIWDTSLKGTKLYEKTITYTDGKPTEAEIVDLILTKTLTKTLTYDVNGNVATVTITLT